MPLYAGVCETNITPPIGVWMSGYGGRPTGAVGVHDDLYARALVLDNGQRRVALIASDLIGLDMDLVTRIREGITAQADIAPDAILLSCTHTHAGPAVRSYRCMGVRDEAYVEVMVRKLIGATKQAAESLQPARLTYGEASAQIAVNRRQTLPDGRVILGRDYGGPVAPLVQTLCVNRMDGRTFALLFCHACHPTTLGGENLRVSAEWPGAAVARLKERFRKEADEASPAEDALPFCLQGCCGDNNPDRRGTWEAIAYNGRVIADAAHTARWSAHGHLDETLEATETTVALPMLPPPSREECARQVAEWEKTLARDREAGASPGRILFDAGRLEWAQSAHEVASRPDFQEAQPFAIQHLNLGGLHLLGFPAEMFVQYQLDFSAQSRAPVMSLGYTNGCWNYVPTAAEYPRGGYEVDDAHRYYGTLMFAPDCERILRSAAYKLLGLSEPDLTPYPLRNGRAHAAP
jgi:hypothetical protein